MTSKRIFHILFIKLILLLFCFQHVVSVNILIISAVTSHSHSLYHQILAKELVKHGHNVTLMIPDYEKSVQNLTIIYFDGVYEKFGIKYNINDLAKENTFSTKLFDWWLKQSQYELESNGFKQIMEYPRNSFDLIIIDVSTAIECFYPLIHKLMDHPLLIGTSPLGIVPWLNIHTGDWIYSSIYPFYSLAYTDKMTFLERVHNFWVTLYLIVYRIYIVRPNILTLIHPFYGNTANYSMAIDKEISLFLINMDANIGYSRPITPNIIPVAGLHIQTKGYLPARIKQFLDNSSEGVILFSLGSNIRSDSLSDSKQQILLEAFSRLPYKVLWKWESDSQPNQPDNVMISKWLPQSDVLDHRNVKIFFTHGGELSIQEAIYFQKPIIGIPFFLDQKNNLNRVEHQGFGIKLEYKTLSVEKVINAVYEIFNNSRYTENVKRISSVFRDQPQTPLERAIFWTEYVIRHKGAKELQPASLQMSFYQTYCLDVIAMTLIVFILIIYIFKIIISKCLWFLIKNNLSKEKLKRN